MGKLVGRFQIDADRHPLTPDGILYTTERVQSVGFHMCDKDVKLVTCTVDPAQAFEDFKVNAGTRLEEDWNEVSLVGVYDSAGDLIADQQTADTDGVLSVFDYRAVDQADGTTEIKWEIRDGLLRVDPDIPAGEEYSHRAYAVGAPDVPAASGGTIRIFDGYVGLLAGGALEARSPEAKVFDPSVAAGANVLRLYLFHPPGAKRTHVLRLVTYRPAGTF